MNTCTRTLAISLLAPGGFAALGAHAQTVSSTALVPQLDSGTLTEIIVTAQKRSERLMDVPMSVTAATGEQLQQHGVTSVADLEKVVPGFTYQPSEYGNPIFSIRGIGFFDDEIAVAPTVSTYLDQAPLPYAAMTEGVLLDVERVEVLKGPQGTLFGENSTGGAINFIANKPTPQFSAGVGGSYGNFNSFSANGFVSGPLTENLLGRLAISTDQRGDWQQSETRDASLGRRDFVTGRALLDWEPREDLRFELNINGWSDKSDTQAAQFVAFSPFDPAGYPDVVPYLEAYKAAPPNDRIADWDPNMSLRKGDFFYQAALRGDWDVSPSATITSISMVADLNVDEPSDTDGTAINNFFQLTRSRVATFTQELRVAGNALDNNLKWMFGGNYQNDSSRENDLQTYDYTGSGIGPLRFSGDITSDAKTTDVYAGFGSLDYQLPQNLTASVSARYTQTDLTFNGCLRDPGDGSFAAAFTSLWSSVNPNLPAIAPGACVTFDPTTLTTGNVSRVLDQNNVSWRTGLSWKPDSHTLLYVNVTKGYKSGNFAAGAAIVQQQYDPSTQESVLADEIGFKETLFNQTLQVSGAGFYYDYSNKQILGNVETILGPFSKEINVPKSDVRGGELDAIWRPIRGLTLSLGGTYVDTRVTSSFVAQDAYGNDVNVKGESFPDAPKWALYGDAEYDFPLSERLGGYVGTSARNRSATHATLGGPSLANDMPAYTLLDLRAGLRTDDGHWQAEIWGHNVTDRFYTTNVTHIADTIAQITGMPATYGVTVNYRF